VKFNNTYKYQDGGLTVSVAQTDPSPAWVRLNIRYGRELETISMTGLQFRMLVDFLTSISKNVIKTDEEIEAEDRIK
jgi:hypothetical protein